jgi:hypothetical protein
MLTTLESGRSLIMVNVLAAYDSLRVPLKIAANFSDNSARVPLKSSVAYPSAQDLL